MASSLGMKGGEHSKDIPRVMSACDEHCLVFQHASVSNLHRHFIQMEAWQIQMYVTNRSEEQGLRTQFRLLLLRIFLFRKTIYCGNAGTSIITLLSCRSVIDMEWLVSDRCCHMPGNHRRLAMHER